MNVIVIGFAGAISFRGMTMKGVAYGKDSRRSSKGEQSKEVEKGNFTHNHQWPLPVRAQNSAVFNSRSENL